MKKKQFSLLFILIIFVNMSTTSGSTKIRNPTALRGIVDSFEPREFLPPRLLFNLGENCHYQTIFGSGVLKQAWSAFKNGEVLNGGKGTMERIDEFLSTKKISMEFSILVVLAKSLWKN